MPLEPEVWTWSKLFPFALHECLPPRSPGLLRGPQRNDWERLRPRPRGWGRLRCHARRAPDSAAGALLCRTPEPRKLTHTPAHLQLDTSPSRARPGEPSLPARDPRPPWPARRVGVGAGCAAGSRGARIPLRCTTRTFWVYVPLKPGEWGISQVPICPATCASRRDPSALSRRPMALRSSAVRRLPPGLPALHSCPAERIQLSQPASRAGVRFGWGPRWRRREPEEFVSCRGVAVIRCLRLPSPPPPAPLLPRYGRARKL